MYSIRKYRTCWAIHNEATGKHRKLTKQECLNVISYLPAFADPRNISLNKDDFPFLDNKP